MSRHLTNTEKQKIETLIKAVGHVITCHQPTESQEEYNEKVPGYIKALLLELVPLSSNDHLVDYANDLKTDDNQDDIYAWLLAIRTLKGNVIDIEANPDRLYRNLFRKAYHLAKLTDFNFAINAMDCLGTLAHLLSREKLVDLCDKLVPFYQLRQANKPSKYEEDVPLPVSQVDIKAFLKESLPKQILHRTRSDSAAIERRTNPFNPLNPLEPLRPKVRA